MLLWKELVDQPQSLGTHKSATQDDLRLLQIYLCRLFLTPGIEPTLNPFSLEENISLLGIQMDRNNEQMKHEEQGKGGASSSSAFSKAIRKRERQLTRSLKGEPNLSFGPLLTTLVQCLKPNRVEIKLLIFGILLTKQPGAKVLLRELEVNELANSVSALAKAFHESPRAIANALDDNSLLCQIRLLEPPSRGTDIYDLVDAGELLHQLVVVADSIDGDQAIVETALFENICPAGPPPAHRIADFQGVKELQLMLDYLKDALVTGQPGRNILLHGKPGTGKTQLARAMASTLGAPLHEVPTKDNRQGAMTGRIRLDAAKLAQMFLEDRAGAILLFDEMEDAFRRDDQLAKGWFNQMLEENKAPVIWISNEIRHIDPAFLRRFDLIIEMNPTEGNRQAEHLKQALSALPVTAPWVDALCRKRWMTPALAGNIVDLARFMPQHQIFRNEHRLEQLMSARLKAMREPDSGKVLVPEKKSDFPAFRTEWLTTTPSLRSVERLVRKDGGARLCLYGPPGAGKTAYATELARRLDRPFELHTASDLQSMYVGEAEKNIARMFEAAEASGAVLLLDEADTFLYSRDRAQHAWETSTINEFMVRMERFQGVFLATTNRFEALDTAIMRRFQLKVRFGYLDQPQLRDVLTACAWDPETVTALEDTELAGFTHITPGLVQVAVQHLKLIGLQPKVRALLRVLAEEQRMQQGDSNSRSIGFHA